MSDIQKVGVVGAGTMGHGIAQVFAHTGHRVTLVDAAPDLLRRAMDHIGESLERLEKKGRLAPESRASVLARVHATLDLDELGDSDLIVEAITEREDAKVALWRRIDQIAPDGAILASNTSSISITRLGAATARPASFIGMHFMNPVPIMKLVEVIRGVDTSDATVATVLETTRALGKTPVQANDFPGFVANRILMPMINEAAFALMEGVATAPDIDEIMKLGMAHPMGPLRLADFIGLDVCLSILEVLHTQLGDPKYRPCPLLRRLVAAGHLGDKTRRGFYRHDG